MPNNVNIQEQIALIEYSKKARRFIVALLEYQLFVKGTALILNPNTIITASLNLKTANGTLTFKVMRDFGKMECTVIPKESYNVPLATVHVSNFLLAFHSTVLNNIDKKNL